MEFAAGAGLVAGLAGTVVMTAVMMTGRAMGMTNMDIALLTGGMMTGDKKRARILGMMLHFVMMGTVVFGLLYAAVFHWLGSAGALTGVLVGLAHGLMVGMMAMPMMAAAHPRMQGGSGGFTLAAPGFMGVGYGKGTPIGLLVGHMLFGLVAALVYAAMV
ncbi:hypothetical protein [Streptomyces halobius]|uniref:Uncharacterized protein n=1 Tax=Streptomyces halobius TaxID=2879846 RepID=A0ABY4M029_9ACTN|nr:hypothetical protein [Streptomyces halobius]UQA91104.1 hypothetical protein K9S39_03685 [Streptomyces halobius]